MLPSVEAAFTSGHVPGHQSVLVRLPRTVPVLLAGDAVTNAGELRADRAPGYFDLDGAASQESTRRLLALVAREGVRLVVIGHDPEQWPTLVRAPGFYD